MLLLLAVLAGLISGSLRAWSAGRKLKNIQFRLVWLVPVAYLPQFLIFEVDATGNRIPDRWVAVTLVSSQLVLLAFAWVNRKRPGFWVLGMGLAMNLAIIALNGGMMPISPETVNHLVPNAPSASWAIGERLGTGKDIVLPAEDTRLVWLSDRFLLPEWFPYRAAFSLGDSFIALGAFWLLWSLGGPEENITKKKEEGEQ